jgi:hypothetical protein
LWYNHLIHFTIADSRGIRCIYRTGGSPL